MSADNSDLSDIIEQCAPRESYSVYRNKLDSLRAAISPVTLTAEQVYQKILLKRERVGKGINTGIEWFDNFAGPLRRGNTYVVAAYPGAGKSTLCLNLAWSIAKQQIPVWYYCLELSSDEVFEVLAGHIVGDADVTTAHETQAYVEIQGTPFRFYEPSKFMPWESRLDEIFRTVKEQGIQVVFIDNLSFLVRVARNQTEAESQASARIKMLAQELEIVIVLIHHLRKPESDQVEPEPNAHGMRGSGAILADASDSFILHHPMDPAGDSSRHQVGYLLSGKPRWGKGGKRYVRLIGHKRLYEGAYAEDYVGKKAARKVNRGADY